MLPGNSAATAGNVLANLGLVRMSVAAHLLDAVFFVLTAMALYVLLQHVHKSMARAMLVFVIVAVGIISLNAVFQFEALQVATGAAYATAFGAAGANALVLLLLDIQHYGTLAAQVFFGLWLAPLGYLAYKSGLFPKLLGVVLIAATVCYLVDLFAAFLVPDARQGDPSVHRHRARHCRDLDGVLPAHSRRADRQSGQMSDPSRQQQKSLPAGRGRRWLVRLGFMVGAFALLLLAGAIYESASEAAEAKAFPPPGQLVDVGGYRLHLNCTGEGSPTVVIDAGLGDWSTSWGLVQPEVAKTTRVCTYDRAGMGWSEPGPRPRDAAHIAKELHTLLENANIPGPYLMVGHSFGGLPVQVFAHEHPAEVAGVVLIESMYPGQQTYATQSQMFSVASVLTRFGIVRLLARPLGLSADVPFAQAASDALSVRPKSLQAFADEIRGIPDSLAQAGAVPTFGELPLIVLSRGLDPDADWQAGQAQLSELSSNSQHLTAEKSDHGIQLQQPEAAVDAITSMIEQLRR